VNGRRSLDERLAAAGVDVGLDPVSAWRRLHAFEGRRATVIDLYELAARPQGLAAHQLPFAERYALARSVMPDVWPGFATTEGSDRTGDPIQIVDYDPTWPESYERWRRRIETVLADRPTRIDHVGSTSVPGLAAKPIIDVQVSVDRLDAEDEYVPALQSIGLQLRSRDDFHRYFRPYPDRPRDVHVHVCASRSDWEREHLLFRDYLRANAEGRVAYGQAKREAAATWADDGIAYTDAKSEVILTLLADAETWRAAGASAG
jgi:GrpB-like predicted nucleotidyltransferase (UPF0157 family)